MKGLYNKYIITKASGKPLGESFYAIVLRIDGGQYVEACRAGVKAFADAVLDKNPKLAIDIQRKLTEFILKESSQQAKEGRFNPDTFREGQTLLSENIENHSSQES